MDGALFRVRSDTKARVLAEVVAIDFHANEVGGYAYNDATNLVLRLNRILEEQLFEFTTDGMTGLASEATNTLTSYKANISITKRDVLREAKATAAAASTIDNKVDPEYTTNTEGQDEADRRNNFRLAAIGVKEGVAAGITKLVGEAITNPVLRAADGINMKTVDEYQLHQLFSAIREGAERPEATHIRRQFVAVASTVFDFRDTMAINVERLATAATKSAGYGVTMQNDLKAMVILANVEWGSHQSWGNEISVALRAIKEKFKYNHVHDADSITAIMKLLAKADEARDKRLAKAPGEVADLVTDGMERLQQLVMQPSEGGYYSDTSGEESANAATTSGSEASNLRQDRGRDRGRDRERERGRSKYKKKKESKTRYRSYSPSPSCSSRSRSASPPRGRSSSKHRDRGASRGKSEERPKNPTKCPHCKKYNGNGWAHGPPSNIGHDECHFNKKYKGWKPAWIGERMARMDAEKGK